MGYYRSRGARAGLIVALPVTGQAALPGFHALLAALVRGGILHLACMAASTTTPDGSGLLLADRLLTAAEVALCPLPAREVTLAACSTGERPEAAGGVRLLGDDVVGLPASFLEAGAAAALVSVTRAGDGETAQFFHAYHSARLGGTPLWPQAAACRGRSLPNPALGGLPLGALTGAIARFDVVQHRGGDLFGSRLGQ